VGVGKKYLDESSLRIAYIGDSDEMLQVSFQMVASPKEVASRLRMAPNGELIDILCIGRSAINISFEDLVAFRLPARTKRLSLGFATKGVDKWEVFGGSLNLITGELEIIGKRNAVIELCSWLNVPITAFN
jgi:hypothetical protein